MHKHRSPTTPTSPKRCRFGLFPVRSPLLRESRLFSFPVTTKMFQFITYASPPSGDTWSSTKWVVPFGNSGVRGYLHLTRTYRSLSRPSSPPRAKASTGRPSFTFLLFELYVQLLLYSTCYSCEIVYYILFFVEIYFVYKLSMNVHLSMRCGE